MSFKKSFAPEDGTIPYRLVGSYEYLIALESLEELMEITTPLEKFTINSLLFDQPEFSFYSGVVSELGVTASLVDADADEKTKFEFAYRKNSLPWLIALARVELGATMSLYGTEQSPFSFFAPTTTGNREYAKLLADDLMTHWNALATDPRFEQVMSSPGSEESLPYLRRLKLIDDMLAALQTSNDADVVDDAGKIRIRIKDLGRELTLKIEKLTEELSLPMLETNEFVKTTQTTETSIKAGTVTSNQLLYSCQRRFLDAANRGAFER